MTIQLLSSEPKIHKLCQEILAEAPQPGDSRRISLIPHSDGCEKADIQIWDFHPDHPFDPTPSPTPRWRLFLVDRNDLEVFYQRVAGTDVHVLLKPVTRSTLSTFLQAAVFQGAARTLRADRDEVLQCLIQTNLKLQEYDHDRTTFLARAVHDFRAPLTALSGYCGLLLSESLGNLNETQSEVLRRMHNSAKRLSRMAGAMFELSVGRHVKRRLDRHAGDIRECLEQALHEIAPFADEKAIAITAELEPCEPGLFFEAGQIVQVLVNILDNACKFTPRCGSIEIRGYRYFWERRAKHVHSAFPAERRSAADLRPNSYRVDIGDSGPAIPNQHLRRIFEEYTSYAGGRDRSGGGLGLAICKMIILQHEGSISVQNSSSGPVFSFLLPMSITPDENDLHPASFSHLYTAGAGRHADH